MAARPKVFVTRRLPEVGLERIRKACDAEVWDGDMPPPYETLKKKVADLDGLAALLTDRIDAALLDAAPRLKVVSNFAVGFNNIDIAAATSRGIAVGNTPGVLTDATADMAFCLLIGAARRLPSATWRPSRWIWITCWPTPILSPSTPT
jgi:glyoxylate reductase